VPISGLANYLKPIRRLDFFPQDQSHPRIIIGNPLNMNGTAGLRTERVKAFADIVAAESGLPVELLDERLTTVSAHRFLSDSGVSGKKRKDSVDELSATLILQNYLDRLKNQK
jgi:putative Holliday junction resolvase